MRAAGREFQCSSASRKFLNLPLVSDTARRTQFQCSSASRKFLNTIETLLKYIPGDVSVLFSEPKISQYGVAAVARYLTTEFQCSSASRKFLNRSSRIAAARRQQFQCSSASRKFLNRQRVLLSPHRAVVSVLFSEPKISQFDR